MAGTFLGKQATTTNTLIFLLAPVRMYELTILGGAMKDDQDFWVEATDKTFLYYRVRARSEQEAMEKYLSGEGDYVGCNDMSDEKLTAILREKPHIDWK